MADLTTRILITILLAVVGTAAAWITTQYLQGLPPALTADVRISPYTPPTGQLPASATCLIMVNVHNTTPKPQRTIYVVANHAEAYSIAPPENRITTGSIAKEAPPSNVIDVLYPGASRRVFVLRDGPAKSAKTSIPACASLPRRAPPRSAT
jgi:hypothetical protein